MKTKDFSVGQADFQVHLNPENGFARIYRWVGQGMSEIVTSGKWDGKSLEALFNPTELSIVRRAERHLEELDAKTAIVHIRARQGKQCRGTRYYSPGYYNMIANAAPTSKTLCGAEVTGRDIGYGERVNIDNNICPVCEEIKNR